MGVVFIGLFSFGKKKVEEPKSKEYYPESIDRTLDDPVIKGHPCTDLGYYLESNFDVSLNYILKVFRNSLVPSDKIDEINRKMDKILIENNELKQRNNTLEAEIEKLKMR